MWHGVAEGSTSTSGQGVHLRNHHHVTGLGQKEVYWRKGTREKSRDLERGMGREREQRTEERGERKRGRVQQGARGEERDSKRWGES